MWFGTRMHKFQDDKYMYYDESTNVFRGPGILSRGDFRAPSKFRGVTFKVDINNTREVLTMAEYAVCPRGPQEEYEDYKARYISPDLEQELKDYQAHVTLVGDRIHQLESAWNSYELSGECDEGDEGDESDKDEADSDDGKDTIEGKQAESEGASRVVITTTGEDTKPLVKGEGD